MTTRHAVGDRVGSWVVTAVDGGAVAPKARPVVKLPRLVRYAGVVATVFATREREGVFEVQLKPLGSGGGMSWVGLGTLASLGVR